MRYRLQYIVSNSITIRIVRYILLAVIPFYVAIIAFVIRIAKGPFFYFNIDHAYMDLFGALNLSCGLLPTDKVYPSSPIYITGALIIRIINFFTKENDILTHVLSNPEMYLSAMTLFWAALNIIAIYCAGVFVYRWSKNILLALVIQMPFLYTHFAIRSSLTVIGVESGMALACTLLSCALVFIAIKNKYTKSIKFAIIMGAIIALGTASKFTFLPLAIIPFISIKGIKNKVIYIICFWFFFLVLMLPYFQMWDDIPSDILGMALGKQGKFSVRAKNPTKIFKNIFDLICMHKSLYYSLICGAFSVFATGIIAFIRKRKGNYVPLKILVAILIGQLCAILAVSGHPAYYYVITSVLLASATLILSYISLISSLNIKKTIYSTLLSIITFGIALYFSSGMFHRNVSSYTKAKDAVGKIESIFNYRLDNYVKIISWGAVGKEAGINFGNDWTGRRHDDIINKIYNKTYLYNPNNKRYTKWREILTLPEISSNNPNIAIKIRPDKKLLPEGEWHEITPGISRKETLFTKVIHALAHQKNKKIVDGYTVYKTYLPLEIRTKNSITDIPFTNKEKSAVAHGNGGKVTFHFYVMEPGEYSLWTTIASEEKHPVNVMCNQQIIENNIGEIVTGGYPEEYMQKIRIADVTLHKGMNTITFSTENEFPALYSILLDEK